MGPSKKQFPSGQLNFSLLITLLILILVSACAPQNQPSPADLPPATPAPTSEPKDETGLLFEEGRYIRDDYCSRIFNYHQANYGLLTIAIADNFIEPQDLQEHAAKVIAHYTYLHANSLVPLSRPVTVYILPDPRNGGCVSNNDLVFVSPDDLDSRTFLEDIFGAGSGINEYWVRAGLTSLALGEQPDPELLKSWYQNTDDLDMAGLFYARFLEDWATEEEIQIARMSANSLVQYALDAESIEPDKLAELVNNDVRTRWLASIGVEKSVTYPYDGRFEGFTYSQSNDCSFIVTADTMTFCLNRLAEQEYFDEISEAEFLIDYAYYGREALIEYLMAEAPSVNDLMDPDELITIEVRELDVALAWTLGNKISMHNSAVYYYVLNEIVHTFNWSSYSSRDELWLIEGFAEYLGKFMTFYPQTEKRAVFEELNGRLFNEGLSASSEGIYIPAGTSYWYFLDPEQFKAAMEWYLAQGGQMESEASVDPLLFADAVSFATMYRDAHAGSRGFPLGIRYDTYPYDFHASEGLELSRTQAASFIGWLCDTYSLDRVMDVFFNQAEDGLLDGKTYQELKSEWLAELVSKGAGIEIPGQP